MGKIIATTLNGFLTESKTDISEKTKKEIKHKLYMDTVEPFQVKWEEKFEIIQKNFNAEVVKNKLTTTLDMNELWDKKYKKTWDEVMRKMKIESIEIWNKYHK